MKAATIHELKKELQQLDPPRLAELCIALAKYKKDNKELLAYLLFESGDKPGFIREVKGLVDEGFGALDARDNLYFLKKSIRKILRLTNKYVKYMGDKQAEVELLAHFCLELKRSRIPFHKSTALSNLYDSQVKKIRKALSMLHEDLQYDYQEMLEKL